MMKDTIKGAFKSWTIWFNSIAVTVLTAFPMIQDSLPQFVPYLDDSIYKKIGVFVVVVNMLLRVKTTKALADK
jgi:hypothetical protein